MQQRQPILDYIFPDKTYVVERTDRDVQWTSGPYPEGFAPPAFFEGGAIVSANNQRPAGWPSTVAGRLNAAPLVHPLVPPPVKDDFLFVGHFSAQVAEPYILPTNSYLQSELNTWGDGVRKYPSQYLEGHNLNREIGDQYYNLLDRIDQYSEPLKFENEHQQEERERYRESLIHQAQEILQTHNLTPQQLARMRASGYRTTNRDLISAPEGETYSLQYGDAEPYKQAQFLPTPQRITSDKDAVYLPEYTASKDTGPVPPVPNIPLPIPKPTIPYGGGLSAF